MSDGNAPLDKYQAAQFLNISHRRLGDRAWRRRVGLPAIRVGVTLRFHPYALRRWLGERSERALFGDAA
jgi:hypothetical protein